MQLNLRDIRLPLRHAFTITHGTTTIQENLLVELSHDGITGYGEGAASPAYKEACADAMRTALEAAREHIERERLDTPAALWDRLFPILGHNRFALCALDQAVHDLWGKLSGSPVWKLWGLTLDHLPLSNYTIGIDTLDTMVAKLKEFDGWPIYKVKLGTPDDLAIIRELRRHTDAVFRIDANTGGPPSKPSRLRRSWRGWGWSSSSNRCRQGIGRACAAWPASAPCLFLPMRAVARNRILPRCAEPSTASTLS